MPDVPIPVADLHQCINQVNFIENRLAALQLNRSIHNTMIKATIYTICYINQDNDKRIRTQMKTVTDYYYAISNKTSSSAEALHLPMPRG